MEDLNGHHQEWLGSTTTNRHGVAALDFATESLRLRSVGCLPSPCTWSMGLLLMTDVPDLLMTDVPDLCMRVAVVAPIDNWDHSSLSAVISMAQAVPNLCASTQLKIIGV